MADLMAKSQRNLLLFTSISPPPTAIVRMSTAFREHAVAVANGTHTRKMIALLCAVVVVTKDKRYTRRGFVTANRVLMSHAAAKYAQM